MYADIPDSDETPTGCLALCQVCHLAVRLDRVVGQDIDSDGEVNRWDYRQWNHVVEHRGYAGDHDPEPMPSPVDIAEARERAAQR